MLAEPLRCAFLVDPDLDPGEFRDLCLYLMFRGCGYLDYDVLWELSKPPWIHFQGSPEHLILRAEAIGNMDPDTITDRVSKRMHNMLQSGFV